MKAIKNVRLPHYDYSANGYYFVTIVTTYRKPLLATRQDMIIKVIHYLETYQGVRIDRYVVMDNHVHVIVVLDECPFSLGEIVRRLKAATSRQAGVKLWQPNYYEHVIRHDAALPRIREYIVYNPLAERIDCERFYENKKL